MTFVAEVFSLKRKLLERFQDGRDKDMTLNQLTSMKVYLSPRTKKSEVTTLSMKPEAEADLEKVYYYGAYFLLQFNREYCVGRKKDKTEMQAYHEKIVDGVHETQ